MSVGDLVENARGCVVRRWLRSFSVARTLKRTAAEAGLDAEVASESSGHSLRVGVAQTLATDGRSVLEIVWVGGLRLINTVSRYIEKADIAVGILTERYRSTTSVVVPNVYCTASATCGHAVQC